MLRTYTEVEVKEATLDYFNGDELAANVWINKYCLKDKDNNFLEKTPDDTHKRLAKEFARIENKYKNALPEKDIYELIKNFKYVVPQGGPMSGVGNKYKVQSLGNCFVLNSPFDSYGGILQTDQEIVQIAKRRGGVGFDISTIRPKGANVNNSANTSDGLALFVERYSNSIGEVAQGGRRGAGLISCSIHHPDILDFVTLKKDLRKATNVNLSVRLTNEFMEAVKNNTSYELRFPVGSDTPIIKKMVDAVDVWGELIKSAWKCGEPGVFFWDTILDNSPADAYEKFRTVCSNPCVSGDAIVITDIGNKTIKELADAETIFKVLSFNESNNGLEFKVAHAFKTKDEKKIIAIELENGSTLKLTYDHKVFVYNNGWVKAKKLRKNDEIIISNGVSRIKDIKSLNEKIEVYDLSVNDNNNYFANGMLVHNCGEIFMGAGASCILTLLNLKSFVKNQFKEDAYFDFEMFTEKVQLATRLLDDLVDLELEKIDQIIEKVTLDPEPSFITETEVNLWENIKSILAESRRVGLGITALGDVFAFLNLDYGSDESISLTEKIYKALSINSYKASCILAKERGPFPAFDASVEKNNSFISKVLNEDKGLYDLYNKHGRRNIALTTTPPAGSVSCETQSTSGIEPVFKLSYKRRRKIGQGENAKVAFIDDFGTEWEEYEVEHFGLVQWKHVSGLNDTEKSPYYNSTSDKIEPIKKVMLQSAAQRWVCHSISNTTNLLKTASVNDVNDIYMMGWQSGCKGMTVYRDGSRSGVLVSKDEEKENKFTQCNAPKRLKELVCDIHSTSIVGEQYIVLVGLYNNKPYELFSGLQNKIKIPRKYKTGKIVKNSKKTIRSTYDLIVGEGDDELVVSDIVEQFDNSNNLSLCRMVSLSLRHGASPKYVVEQLQKNKDSDFYSFTKGLARIVKGYISDGESANGMLKACPDCGQEDGLVYQGGCIQCSCGWSKCD